MLFIAKMIICMQSLFQMNFKDLLQIDTKKSFQSHCNWPPVYLFFEKLVFSLKNYMMSSLLHIVTYLGIYISFALLAHKTDLMIGLTYIIHWYSRRHLTTRIYVQVWKYMSAEKYNFLICVACVKHYNQRKFVRINILSKVLDSKYKNSNFSLYYSLDVNSTQIVNLEYG